MGKKAGANVSRALVPRNGYDIVYSPPELAELGVDHFRPRGVVLEPCSGGGAFVKALKDVGIDALTCEIAEGVDFMDFEGKVDWVITNPPWSKFCEFLEKSVAVANDVVFLVTINHFMTKKRMRIVHEAGFNFREILMVDTPKSFPQSGFQLGFVHISKEIGPCLFSYRGAKV